jgi:hypothetical protein
MNQKVKKKIVITFSLSKLKIISCAQFEMSVFGRKKTFMIKILIRPYLI